MAAISVSILSQSGAALALAAASVGGDSLPNTGREFLRVKNADSSSTTVTINSIQNCNQGFDHNLVITVAAGADKVIGPFPVARFSSTVGITYSSVTSLTVGAFRAT